MTNSAKEIRESVKELKLSSRTLVYPHNLRDMINEVGEDGDDQISFVKLVPSSARVVVPTIVPEEEEKKKKVKDDDPNKVEVKYLSIDVDAIFLPIRPTEDTIVGSWQSVEGMGFGDMGSYLKWKMYKALSGVASTILPQEAVFAMKSGAFGGGIDNPHDRLAFGGHSRRSFQIAWEFMKPSSREEEETLHKIVSILRMTSLGGYGQYVITPPANWNISFHSLPNYKNYLRYNRCGFSSVGVRFGGDVDFHAMESGMPFMSLTLDVNELDYPTRKDVWVKPIDLVSQRTDELTEEEREKQKKNYQSVQNRKDRS